MWWSTTSWTKGIDDRLISMGVFGRSSLIAILVIARMLLGTVFLLRVASHFQTMCKVTLPEERMEIASRFTASLMMDECPSLKPARETGIF